ncbi:MAG: hypothetical protein HY235_01880 [Acidobacteria bacterium]|nr:hypothetical protein [Acidobacteriota bacterium]
MLPEQRATFLEQACAGESELRKEVESLQAFGAEASGFIEKPAIEIAAREMAKGQSRGNQSKRWTILIRDVR